MEMNMPQIIKWNCPKGHQMRQPLSYFISTEKAHYIVGSMEKEHLCEMLLFIIPTMYVSIES